MKIMITGSGGREHALAAAFLKNKRVENVYCIPGNGGTEDLDRCENVELSAITDIVRFASEEKIDLVMPGSEASLVEGIADRLQEAGIKVFGPRKNAAMLEGSKAFAKDFMKKYGIRTAGYRSFTDFKTAMEYAEKCPLPAVVKADGLAAGKGVIICRTGDDIRNALKLMMVDRAFGDSGKKVVMEEFLEGFEASIHCFFDGETFVPLLSAKDHKKIGEGETGPNTGGMGVVVPNPGMSEELWADFTSSILEPTKKGLLSEDLRFSGVIFFGLMIQNGKCSLLEYNMRMGDPETQGMLAMLESDFTSLVEAAVSGELSNTEVRWKDGSACCVVLASRGYPGKYETGFKISGIPEVTNSAVHPAGMKKIDGIPVTSGGRVLSIVSNGHSLFEARERCYREVNKISFEGMTFRKDIGLL